LDHLLMVSLRPPKTPLALGSLDRSLATGTLDIGRSLCTRVSIVRLAAH
jgi:hypothetical protein